MYWCAGLVPAHREKRIFGHGNIVCCDTSRVAGAVLTPKWATPDQAEAHLHIIGIWISNVGTGLAGATFF